MILYPLSLSLWNSEIEPTPGISPAKHMGNLLNQKELLPGKTADLMYVIGKHGTRSWTNKHRERQSEMNAILKLSQWSLQEYKPEKQSCAHTALKVHEGPIKRFRLGKNLWQNVTNVSVKRPPGKNWVFVPNCLVQFWSVLGKIKTIPAFADSKFCSERMPKCTWKGSSSKCSGDKGTKYIE